MDLKKRCQWCGKYFIAHKMTTLYCSSSCIDKAYKAKKKQQIKKQVEEEQQSKLPIVGSIDQKPFLSPQEAACLLGVSLPTIYRYMAQGLFKALRTPIRITYYRGSHRFDEIKKKYELIVSHTGRRSFICNALSMGISPQVVMKWTGFSDYKAMKPYIDVCDDIKAEAMKKFDDF